MSNPDDNKANRHNLMQMNEGDTQNIEQLFNQYFDRLYSIVYYKVGRNRGVAEDIVQETFLAATKSIKNFQHKSSPYTWLVSIAYHKITDYYRRNQTKRKHYGTIANLDSIDESKINSNEKQFISEIEDGDSSSAIQEILNQLPRDYKTVLILKYVEEMTVS